MEKSEQGQDTEGGRYERLRTEVENAGATLVVVSKTRRPEELMPLYAKGQRIFAENRVQELLEKRAAMPEEVEWHVIGHLQTNKVKAIAPFVAMIQSVDSVRLLEEINLQAIRCGRTIPVLLQVFIAAEETKFGMQEEELFRLLGQQEVWGMQGIDIRGLMGMATQTEDREQVRTEFGRLRGIFDRLKGDPRYRAGGGKFQICSMGMSQDYQLALQEGSTMVRIGSLLFGR